MPSESSGRRAWYDPGGHDGGGRLSPQAHATDGADHQRSRGGHLRRHPGRNLCRRPLPADFKKYDKSLSVFGRVPIPKKIWPSLGRNLALLAAKGITVPFPDALIATVALENDLELWHHDRHFPDIHKVIPQLKLFKEPP